METAPLTALASAPSSEPPTARPHQLHTVMRSYMLSTAAGSCFVAFLALALTVVWRRKQRWRRARPWLTKLRAETASKTEKEKATTIERKDTSTRLTTKDTLRGKDKLVILPQSDTRSDGGSASGKRTKERRKRGKETKPTTRNTSLFVPVSSHDANSEAQAFTPALVGDPSKSQEAPAQPPTSQPTSTPPYPHLIPLPPSPLLNATPKLVPPALILSGPTSPVSTLLSMSAAATERTITTPGTSTSVSPAPASPAFNMSETTTTAAVHSKLPAFPPASPLPPNLARKAPPVVRRPTASTSTPTSISNVTRKGSQTVDRRREPNRKGSMNEESDAPPEEIEFPTLNPWPLVGKQGENTKRRDREGRRVSDVGRDGRKASDVGRGRKPSDARKKAGSGATNPESTQLASLRGALEAARLREEEVAEERRAWAKKERDLQTQVNQLSHQLQIAVMVASTGSGGMQPYPGYGYGYGHPTLGPGSMQPPNQLRPESTPSDQPAAPLPTAAPPSDSPSAPSTPAPPSQLQPHSQMYFPLPFPSPFPMLAPPSHGPLIPNTGMPPPPSPHAMSMPPHGSPMPSPMPPHSPMGMPVMPMQLMSPPHGSMSPPQPHAAPYMFSPHGWGGGSPRTGAPVPNPVMMTPGGGPPGMNAGPVPGMIHPVPGRRTNGFFASSPGRGSSRSRSPYVHTWGEQRRRGTPSTPSVGSVDDGLFGASVVHPPPATLGSLKREREPDQEEDEGSSSQESDEDEESDDDSVIFEDGSVSDSVNLSLRGESKEPDLVAFPIEIQIGESETS